MQKNLFIIIFDSVYDENNAEHVKSLKTFIKNKCKNLAKNEIISTAKYVSGIKERYLIAKEYDNKVTFLYYGECKKTPKYESVPKYKFSQLIRNLKLKKL